jgi:hypothetical protein
MLLVASLHEVDHLSSKHRRRAGFQQAGRPAVPTPPELVGIEGQDPVGASPVSLPGQSRHDLGLKVRPVVAAPADARIRLREVSEDAAGTVLRPVVHEQDLVAAESKVVGHRDADDVRLVADHADARHLHSAGWYRTNPHFGCLGQGTLPVE